MAWGQVLAVGSGMKNVVIKYNIAESICTPHFPRNQRTRRQMELGVIDIITSTASFDLHRIIDLHHTIPH
jgi:hypothetical protein